MSVFGAFRLGVIALIGVVAALLVLPDEAAAQNFPGGSWRQSCRDARMEGRDTLRAECQRRNGSWNRTGIDIDKCGRGGTVANSDGNLVCESFGTQGGGQGPWWGKGLPAGSYQRSCRNARLEGRDLLIAQCQRQNGSFRNTRLDIDECRGRDIANDNGHLECGGKIYGGSYGQYQLPPGSWSQSCRNARIVRDDLFAECRQRDGDWVRASLDLDDCRGQAVSNDNGRLVCGGGNFGGGYNNRLPPGSWQQSCRNPRFGSDGRFYADCRERDGRWNTDGIDLRDCRGQPVYNDDGKLRC